MICAYSSTLQILALIESFGVNQNKQFHYKHQVLGRYKCRFHTETKHFCPNISTISYLNKQLQHHNKLTTNHTFPHHYLQMNLWWFL